MAWPFCSPRDRYFEVVDVLGLGKSLAWQIGDKHFEPSRACVVGNLWQRLPDEEYASRNAGAPFLSLPFGRM